VRATPLVPASGGQRRNPGLGAVHHRVPAGRTDRGRLRRLGDRGVADRTRSQHVSGPAGARRGERARVDLILRATADPVGALARPASTAERPATGTSPATDGAILAVKPIRVVTRCWKIGIEDLA